MMAQASPVDSGGVDLVNDPDSGLAPDFMTADPTLLALDASAPVSDADASSDLTMPQADPASSASSNDGADETSVAQADGNSDQDATLWDSESAARTSESGASVDFTHWGLRNHTASAVDLSIGGSNGDLTSFTATEGGRDSSANSGSVTVSVTSTEADIQFNGAAGQQTAAAGPTISLSTLQSGAQITRDGYHWNT